MFESLLITALLTLTDPTGDVVGADSLQPPTAGVYRNLAPFDLRRVTIDDDQRLTLQIEMGSLANPFELPLGFSLPVIEVYLEERDEGAGRQRLLSGSSMRLPQGRGWEVAIRLTGETATAYRVVGKELQEATPAVAVDGNILTVRTPFERPRNPQVYAMTGLYDLFGASPWRPIEPSESPWAFSSSTQRVPVVDVLARTPAAQRQSIESQVLTPAGSRGSIGGSIWLVLMAIGMFVALVGVAMRSLARGIVRDDDGRTSESKGNRVVGPVSPPAGAGQDPPVEPETTAETTDSPGPAPVPEADEEAQSERRPTETSEERAAFAWDSSALLTKAEEDDFADEFGTTRNRPEETTVVSERGAPDRTSAVWERPVPLKLSEDSNVRSADDEPEELPEVVRDGDKEEDVAGPGDEDASAVSEERSSMVERDESEANGAELEKSPPVEDDTGSPNSEERGELQSDSQASQATSSGSRKSKARSKKRKRKKN